MAVFSHGWLWLPGKSFDVCEDAQGEKLSGLRSLCMSYLLFLKKNFQGRKGYPLLCCTGDLSHFQMQKIAHCDTRDG